MARAAEDPHTAVHARVLRGDVASTSIAFEALYEPLVRRLKARHRLNDPQTAEVAASEALLGYFRQPERFDPERLRLFSYLGSTDVRTSSRTRRVEDGTPGTQDL